MIKDNIMNKEQATKETIRNTIVINDVSLTEGKVVNGYGTIYGMYSCSDNPRDAGLFRPKKNVEMNIDQLRNLATAMWNWNGIAKAFRETKYTQIIKVKV